MISNEHLGRRPKPGDILSPGGARGRDRVAQVVLFVRRNGRRGLILLSKEMPTTKRSSEPYAVVTEVGRERMRGIEKPSDALFRTLIYMMT